MKNKAKLIVDIMVETTEELNELERLAREFNIKLTVVNTEGPGGGWPEVKLEGELGDLVDFLYFEYLGRDFDELNYFLTNLIEVNK